MTDKHNGNPCSLILIAILIVLILTLMVLVQIHTIFTMADIEYISDLTFTQ